LTINNSTLSGNFANDGGGIYNDGDAGIATLTIKNSTLSGNWGFDGGILNDGRDGGSATLTIGSTILTRNLANSDANIVNESGTITSLGYNLSSDGTGPNNGTTDLLNTVPMLGPLQDNGGATKTHALLLGSPAIDKGNNFTGATTDQRGTGFARTFDNISIA